MATVEQNGGPAPAIVVWDLALEWYRRPSSKKRRIRNKWRKVTSNSRPIILKWPGPGRGVSYFVHPSLEDRLRAHLRGEGQVEEFIREIGKHNEDQH